MSNALATRNTVGSKVRHILGAPARLMASIDAAVIAFMCSVSPAFCQSGNTGSMNALFKSMVNIVCDIAFYVGAIIIVSGVFNWVLAQKDENADGQSRAIKFIVCGFALVSLKVIVNPLLTNLGLG